MFYERSEDYRPLFWLQGHPIYVNTLIFLLNILGFVGTALAVSFLGEGIIDLINLSSYQVLHGEVWRLFTYITFLPTPSNAITFIFAMGFLYHFGKQVEDFVGRKVYLKLYAALVLIPSVLFCLVCLVWPQDPYLGGYGTIFGVFVAFATIYPSVPINIWFVNLSAKGWAFALLGALTLAYIAWHDWIGLGGLWCDAAIGYFGLRLIGAGRGMTWLTEWLEDRRTERLARQRNFKVLEEKKASESLDAILEKISKQGVGSLDSRERAVLERARTNLLKRDQR
jgi:membrane associated rhomboid family serine protease